MKRLLSSIRFQLIFVLLVFIMFTFFLISSNITSYLRESEIKSEAKQLNLISNQVADKFGKMYIAQLNAAPQSQEELYINLFLKKAFNDYITDISTAFPDVEMGYYLPVFKDPLLVINENGALLKKVIVVSEVSKEYGGGYVFVSVPQETIEMGVSNVVLDINRIVIYPAILTLIVVLLITTFFSLRIMRLRRGLKQLEKNLDFRFPNYSGEIGDIATSINSMAENLKRNIEESQKAENLRMLGLLTVGIVHEVRNPLTAIKGFATMLNQKLQGKEEQRYVLPILNESERLQRIVDDLLKYGRPSPLSLVKFDLRQFFEHIVELAKSYVSNKNINFKINCDNITIYADERKLEELFLNLVINAIQSIDRMDGNIEINCKKEGKFVNVEIVDDGVGMDEKTLKNIFVPFFTTKEKGTGLGLAIVHRIVEEHHGDIFVESEKGKGTKFTVKLPLESVAYESSEE